MTRELICLLDGEQVYVASMLPYDRFDPCGAKLAMKVGAEYNLGSTMVRSAPGGRR